MKKLDGSSSSDKSSYHLGAKNRSGRQELTRYSQIKRIEALAAQAGFNKDDLDDKSSDLNALVKTCYDAMENHRPKQWAQNKAQEVLSSLKQQERISKNKGHKLALAELGAALSDLVVMTLYPRKSTEPQPEAQRLLDTMVQAAQQTAKAGTLDQEAVVTHQNAMLGPVLHTGDEIWSAAASVIKNATSSVRLQTWAYHRRSESARHIMAALAELQLSQAQKRSEGEKVVPIEVEILLGSGLVGWGSDSQSGGKDNRPLAQSLDNDKAGIDPFHYKIFPFAVDPSLMRVSFRVNQHKKRGAMHSKTLIVDDQVGMVTSANVKGSHHRANNFGSPFHDFGIFFGGPFVQSAMLQDFKTNFLASKEFANNAQQTTVPQADLVASIAQGAAELQTVPLDTKEKSITETKIAEIKTAIQNFQTGNITPNTTLVALSKKPVDALWTKADPSPQRSAFLAALDGAQSIIEINNTNFNADEIMAALKRALSRGVSVDIISSEGYADAAYASTNSDNRSMYHQLAKFHSDNQCSGHLRLRWHPDASSDDSFYKASHTKAMFIDQAVAIVGSSNLDAQSWTYSGEFNVATHDPYVLKTLRGSLFSTFWEMGRNSIEFAGRNSEGENSGAASLVSSWAQTSLDSPESLVADPPGWKSGLLSASDLHRQFKNILASADSDEKMQFSKEFYRDYAPRLRTEEAALERLTMRENRMDFKTEEARFGLFVEQNVLGDAVTDYAPSYMRKQTFVSEQFGTRAALYVPDVPEAQASQYRSILTYEGVTFRQDGQRKKQNNPTGLRDALDPKGVGYTAFEAEKDMLMSLTQKLIDAGQKITLTGYSLGGAMASRHMAAYTPEQQKQLRLITFSTPGLDEKTSQRMPSDIDARHFRTRNDPVTKVGSVHVPGLVFKSPARIRFPSWRNHTAAPLSTGELSGANFNLGMYERGSEGQRRRSSALEFFRRVAGWLPLPR